MIEQKFIIHENETLLSALKQINRLVMPDPLVLFVVDGQERMVGTLTDGDSRRALIAGVSVNDTIDHVMHRNFNSLTEGVDYDVRHLHVQKEKKIDAFKWSWLDERTFFDIFSIDAVFAYFCKLEMLERWEHLDVEEGKETFKQIIENLRGEAKVPEEFVR